MGSAPSLAVCDAFVLSDEEIAELTPAEREEYWHILVAEADREDLFAWREHARSEQLPPAGDWSALYYQGGRGSGKTFASARVFAELWATDPLRQTEGAGEWAAIGPTFGQTRDVVIEGEAGLLAALGTSRGEVDAGRSLRVERWNRSLGEMRLRDGSVIYIDGADDGARRIQGLSLRGALLDEIGLWRDWKTSFDESIRYALRKGEARLVAAGTPKADMPARELIRRLISDPAVAVRRLRTIDNAENLSPAFLAAVREQAGTRLARQELEGELLEDVEGALWRRQDLDDHRVSAPPGPQGECRVTVVALDPSDGSPVSDEQALCVAGVGSDGDFYILRSDGMRVSPMEYCERAIGLAVEFRAACIVIESNTAKAWLREVLQQAMRETGRTIAVVPVNATVGKRTRAEPIAALASMGRVHMVGRRRGGEESRSPRRVLLERRVPPTAPQQLTVFQRSGTWRSAIHRRAGARRCHPLGLTSVSDLPHLCRCTAGRKGSARPPDHVRPLTAAACP
jgi:phage terminase large subunit-like protein